MHAATDEDVLAELRTLSGPNQAILADPEVLAMFLPAIRSDYTAIESYRHDPGRLLDCPVTVLTGDADPRTTLDEAPRLGRNTPPARPTCTSSRAVTSSTSNGAPRSSRCCPAV